MRNEVERQKRENELKTIEAYKMEQEAKKIQAALEVVASISDPVAKADAFQKMLNPQQIINNV